MCAADDEDEFIGALSLGQAQDDDSDVRAVDRFHGLRVAHPLEAHKMGQGVTVGRDALCSLVVDQPSVSCAVCVWVASKGIQVIIKVLHAVLQGFV